MNNKQRLIIGIGSACSVVLIAVSMVGLLGTTQESSLAFGNLLQTTEQTQPEQKQKQKEEQLVVDELTQKDEAAIVSDEVVVDVPQGREAPVGGNDGSSSPAAKSPDENTTKPNAVDPSSEKADEAPVAPPKPETVTVTVSVTSASVGGIVSSSGTRTFSPGANVYDALSALGLSVNASATQQGIYVAGIGGLAEKDHGGGSGWKYSVNGEVPSLACDAYILKEGDIVEWFYVLTA